MPRDYKAHENQKKAKARRAHALSRTELRQPSVARVPASGPVSMGIKATNPEDDRIIAEFLKRRKK